MRHLGSCGLRLLFGALALGGGIDDGAATPLDFLFGGPPLASRPASRLRRRPAHTLPQAEIPLPVPRPRFPGDPGAGDQVARSSEAAKPSETAKLPEQPAKSADTPEATAGAPPVPPPKPPDLGTPGEPARTALPAEPEAPKSEAPNSMAPKSEVPKPQPTKPEPSKPEPTKPLEQPPIPPPKPPEVTKPGAPPAVAPSGATTSFAPRSPDDDPQCPSRLAVRRVGAETIAIGPQPDERCTVVEPVRLTDLVLADGSKVAFPEHPTIACTTADAFSSYVRDLLVPLAKGTFGAPITAVWTGPGLECRARDHLFGAKLSAHGQGLAIDIAQVKLADGRMIEVGTPKTDAETGFETAARAGACGYFHTVLGPGSDAYHRTHWHFDLEVRGAHGDSKYCK